MRSLIYASFFFLFFFILLLPLAVFSCILFVDLGCDPYKLFSFFLMDKCLCNCQAKEVYGIKLHISTKCSIRPDSSMIKSK